MATYLANHPTERLVATDLGSLPLFVGCIHVFGLPLPMFEILEYILWNTNMLVLLPQKIHHNRFPGRGNCDLGRITQWRETNASTVCFNLNAVWELPADAGYNWEIRETQSKIANLLDPWVAYVSSYTSWCVKYCNETSEEPCNIKKQHHQNWENCYHRLGKLLAPWLPTNITNYGYPFQHPRVLLSGSGKLWIGLVFEQHVFARHLLVRSSSQDSASWPMVPWDVRERV